MKYEIGILISDDEPFVNGGVHDNAFVTAIAGVKIDTLPVISRDEEQDNSSRKRKNVFSQQVNLKQWSNFLSALHSMALQRSDVSMSFALQFTAIPRHNFGAKVDIYFLVRVSAQAAIAVKERIVEVIASIRKMFPKGDLIIPVVAPTPMAEDELRESLFHNENNIRLFMLHKFIERASAPFDIARSETTVLIPHPFLSGGDSPVEVLIDVLEQAGEKVCVRCEIEPTRLTADEEEFATLLSHLFERTAFEGARQYDIVGERASREQMNRSSGRRAMKDWAETVSEVRAARAARLSPHQIKSARRGQYVFQRLYEEQAKLFTMSITIACAGDSPVPNSVTASVMAAVSSTENQEAMFGWRTPKLIKPENGKEYEAIQTFKWMSASLCHPVAEQRRWNSFASAREALTYFHLPALNGPAVGVETTSVPFYVTAEFLKSIQSNKNGESRITLGYVYHSNICHDPLTVGVEKALPFRLPLKSLTKPALISGSPGGGKTNWVFCLLVDLWKEHAVPWCVVDPSGGQEYRYLLAEESLKDHLVVYTLGDNHTSPFRFNPFALPPSGPGGSNTVRSHVARLISCFKAASDMWTPLPEIFQEAICRAYKNFGWAMDDTFEMGKDKGLRFPSFTDFARALNEELDENVIPNYGRGTEAAGVLLGGTRDRVNSIVSQLGHILDVTDDAADLYQNLLRTPCVLELGSLGSEDAIALVMSFLLVQIAGHTEYAYRTGLRRDKQHLLCVEEAHILLSGESSKTNAMQQGNPRGKAAEDFGRLLLEFRKFGTGVMLIDQRIASLIGSAVDSSYLNIMFRTVAPASFDHLKTILNLNTQQIEYAHTQLDEGRCILTDRASGRPVLIKQKNTLDELKAHQLTFDEFIERTKRNAQNASLVTPEYVVEKTEPAVVRSKRVFQPRDSR